MKYYVSDRKTCKRKTCTHASLCIKESKLKAHTQKKYRITQHEKDKCKINRRIEYPNKIQWKDIFKK